MNILQAMAGHAFRYIPLVQVHKKFSKKELLGSLFLLFFVSTCPSRDAAAIVAAGPI